MRSESAQCSTPAAAAAGALSVINQELDFTRIKAAKDDRRRTTSNKAACILHPSTQQVALFLLRLRPPSLPNGCNGANIARQRFLYNEPKNQRQITFENLQTVPACHLSEAIFVPKYRDRLKSGH